MTAGAMDGDRRWAESRFGDLEAFILDFLMGGSRAGERVRVPCCSGSNTTVAYKRAFLFGHVVSDRAVLCEKETGFGFVERGVIAIEAC